MTAYRETMGQVLQRMYDNKQLQIQERELSGTELKRREEIAKELPDEEFKDRYGSRWKEVKLATATKQAKSESVEEEKLEKMDEAAGFSAGMISKLKKSYDGLKTINPTSPTAKKLFGVLDKMNKEQLIQIVKADINFLSLLAANRLIKDHNMKGAEINKLKESIRNEGYKPVKDNHYDVKVTLSDKEVKDVEKFIMNSPEYNKGDIEDVDMDQVMGGGMKFKGTGDIFIQGDDAGSLGVDLQKKFGRKIKVVGEETIHERSRQLKDPKKEMMISYKGSVMVINKKDWPKYEKKGAVQAEQLAKIKGNTPAADGRRAATQDDIDRAEKKGDKKLVKKLKEEVELDESVIDKVKEIASKKSAAKIDGVMVDSFSASAISQIYDKVNDANKKKMEKLPITKLANLAFKMMQKNDYVPEEAELDEGKGKAKYTRKLMKNKSVIGYVRKQQEWNRKYVAKWGNAPSYPKLYEPRFDPGTGWNKIVLDTQILQKKLGKGDTIRSLGVDFFAEYEAVAKKLGLDKFGPKLGLGEAKQPKINGTFVFNPDFDEKGGKSSTKAVQRYGLKVNSVDEDDGEKVVEVTGTMDQMVKMVAGEGVGEEDTPAENPEMEISGNMFSDAEKKKLNMRKYDVTQRKKSAGIKRMGHIQQEILSGSKNDLQKMVLDVIPLSKAKKQHRELFALYVNEEVELDEKAKYDIYHKDFSSAMQHAYKAAKKMYGITVDPKEIDDKVATGPRKPSKGKTNSYRLKGDKGAIQVQVANLDNKKYELNMYKESHEMGTDEYRKYLEDLTPHSTESARSDAMRSMRRDKSMFRGKDSADVDDVATKDDRKAASKNILQQLKKTLDTKGKTDIEFLDKKKKKVPYDIAVKAVKKYMGFRSSTDKLKFQQALAKSYKSMLQAVKEDYVVPKTHSESILDRIDTKLKEKKNG